MLQLTHPEIGRRFEVLGKLSEGGMGAVYKVRHRALGDVRVIKVMRTELREQEELRERFVREARVAAEVVHPNLTRLLDFEIGEDGAAYMVLEYVEGLDLRQALRRGVPSVAAARRIGSLLAEAIAFLHERAFVHRDISPDNAMLTRCPSGPPTVKLLDLGLARSLEMATRLTRDGTFLGKFHYAAPECFGDEDVGPPADVYSLGIVLYELATGRYPISGKTPPSIVAGHLHRPPLDFDEADPTGRVGPELREVILGCLEKAAENRPTAAEVAEQLRLDAEAASAADEQLLDLLATSAPSGPASVPLLPEEPASTTQVSEVDREGPTGTMPEEGLEPGPHGSLERSVTEATPAPRFTRQGTGGSPPVGATERPTKKIFISYRRADSAGYAGRLFDRLANHFGREEIFMDVDAIGAGSDFIAELETAVGSCAVTVVLIGPRWLTIGAPDGSRRLDDPEDFVRLEVQTALHLERTVIPLLVDGAGMPGFGDLPESLAGLARRNAVELSNGRWDYDVGQLIGAIEAAGVAPAKTRSPVVRGLAAAGVVLALATGAIVSFRTGDEAGPVATGVEEGIARRPVEVRPTVAVAGMEAGSEGEEAAWTATAAAEILDSHLAAGGGVRTISPAEVEATRRGLGLSDGPLPGEDLLRLGKALGADWFVGGRLERLPGEELAMLRVRLELRSAATGETLDSGEKTGMVQDLFDVVGRALEPLREPLGLGVLSAAQTLEVRASVPEDPDAARLYAGGLEALRTFDALTARDLLERAIRASPEHPMLHAALARAWDRVGYRVEAEKEAARAVELGGDLGEPVRLSLEAQHAELAQDWPKAIRTYEMLFQAFPDDLALGLQLADVQISAGRTEEARGVLEALRELPSEAADDPAIDLMASKAAFSSGDFEGTKRFAERAAEKAEAAGNAHTRARAAFWIAQGAVDLGELELAETRLEEARGLFSDLGDRHLLAQTLELVATVAYRSGDVEGSRRLMERALETHRQAGDRLAAARVEANLAVFLRLQGELSVAEGLFEKALETALEIGARYEAAQFLQEMAVLHHLSGSLDSAQELYGRALSLYTEIDERRGAALALTNLGEIAYLRGELDEAESLHRDARATNDEIGDRAGKAWDTYRLGLVALARGELEVAAGRLEEALALQIDLGDGLGAAETRIAQARRARLAGDPEAGREIAARAAETLGAEGVADLEARALAELGRCRIEAGESEEAGRVFEELERLAATSQDAAVAFDTAALEAELALEAGSSKALGGARRRVEARIAEAAGSGRLLDELELRLVLARLVVAEGEESEAAALAHRAEELGLRPIAEAARSL